MYLETLSHKNLNTWMMQNVLLQDAMVWTIKTNQKTGK